MLQALIIEIRSEIDPPNQTCYQDHPSHLHQHRPTSTSCPKSSSAKFITDQPGSPPCKHSSAAVSDSCLATTKAESTFGLSQPVAEPDTAGSLTVQEGHGVEPVGAIAKATQRYGTSSKRATAIAQAAAAKRKSPSRSTVKPGALATLNAKAAAFSPSASHHTASAPLSIITEAEGHAAKTESGDGRTKTSDAGFLTAANQELASRAAARVKPQSMLPEQAPATGTAAHSAAAQQADSKSVKTVPPSSSLPWDALANHLAASANPGAASANLGLLQQTLGLLQQTLGLLQQTLGLLQQTLGLLQQALPLPALAPSSHLVAQRLYQASVTAQGQSLQA